MLKTITTLDGITLAQWLAFQEQNGQELQNRWEQIESMPEGQEREDATLICQYDTITRTLMFYSGVNVDELPADQEREAITMQAAALQLMEAERELLHFSGVHTWRGDQWEVQPVYTSGGKLNYSEFEMSQEIALMLAGLQDGDLSQWLNLCAAYLRKPGEPYTSQAYSAESNTWTGNTERVELMRELPLSLAVRVMKYVELAVKVVVNNNLLN